MDDKKSAAVKKTQDTQASRDVDAAGAMVGGWQDIVASYQKKLKGKYLDYFNKNVDNYIDWAMDGENDSYPIAAWFYANGFDEALDDDVFKELDI